MNSPIPRLRWILGSRSPRRLELLRTVAGESPIEVLPPSSIDEASFDGLSDWASIERRLRDVTRAKSADVLKQLAGRASSRAPEEVARTLVVSADTTIVVQHPDEELCVLGQPPETGDWKETVRRWFREFYFGRTHIAATAVRVAALEGESRERVVRTRVTFHADGERWLEWYLRTGEPLGKAGGYAIQGAGSVFVSKVEGSVSNVVGLPLRELLQMTDELNRES